MTRIVLFFSATGNCLYVARELAKCEGGKTVSIPQAVKEGRYEFEADEIGVVCPVYAAYLPDMVRDFLERATLKASYLFFVATYGMTPMVMADAIERAAAVRGIKFDYIQTLLMVDNWLHNFDMREQEKMDKHTDENLAQIIEDVKAHKQWKPKITDEERKVHSEFIDSTGLDKDRPFRFESSERFGIRDSCIRCGTCSKVCPHGNWEVTSNGVKVHGTCDYCLACIHNCPKNAIYFLPHKSSLLKEGPNPEEHYRNPHVKITDIMEANNQH